MVKPAHNEATIASATAAALHGRINDARCAVVAFIALSLLE
jgi:hypothetical protein